MEIITWNVNSIKVRVDYALRLAAERHPDVLMLQEIKCQTQNFPSDAFEKLGYFCYVNGQKTHNGVAFLSREPCKIISDKLPGFTEDEARYLEVICCGVRLINVYVPFGQSIDDAKFQKKIRFLEHLADYLRELIYNEEDIIIGGDFNVAVESIDTFAQIEDSVCYAMAVRRLIRSILHFGYYDVFRALNPDSCQFSWWDYRARCFERNMGMRLDYFLLSPKSMDRAESCTILSDYRSLKTASDHAPVSLIIASS